MPKLSQPKIYIVAILLLLGLSLSAQFNIKIGYEYNRSSDQIYNDILDVFNDQLAIINSELESPISQIQNKSGIALGVRYRYSIAAIELFAHRTSGDQEALGNNNGISFNEKLTSTNLYYGIAGETQIGFIGFGASFGYETLKFKSKITSSSKSREFFNQKEVANRLYLNFEFASDKIAFSLKPYYHYSLGEYDLLPLKNELIPNVDIGSEDLFLKPSSWGITVILYNGLQPD